MEKLFLMAVQPVKLSTEKLFPNPGQRGILMRARASFRRVSRCSSFSWLFIYGRMFLIFSVLMLRVLEQHSPAQGKMSAKMSLTKLKCCYEHFAVDSCLSLGFSS